jgi:hypothetical protein
MMTYKEFMALPRGGWLEAEETPNGVLLSDIKTGKPVVEIELVNYECPYCQGKDPECQDCEGRGTLEG